MLEKDNQAQFNVTYNTVKVDVFLPTLKKAYKLPVHRETIFHKYASKQLPGLLKIVQEADLAT